MIFSNARFRVSHSRNKNRVVALLGFSRLGFLWELVIREERFWNFYCGVVTRRHSFGFSRNNMKGALYHWRNQWVRNAKKGKFLIFRFWRCQVLGMKSLTCRFLNEIEKRLNAPSILMEVQATISRTDLTKLQTLGSIILLSFFEYLACTFAVFD